MPATGSCRLIWAGGEHDFCLAAVEHIFALQNACNCGIAEVLSRLLSDRWYLNDVRETMRLALIGGGMKPEPAMQLIKLHVDANPKGLADSVLLAITIIKAVLVGVPDDPVGKVKAPGTETQAQVSTTTTAVSGAQPSTEPVQL